MENHGKPGKTENHGQPTENPWKIMENPGQPMDIFMGKLSLNCPIIQFCEISMASSRGKIWPNDANDWVCFFGENIYTNAECLVFTIQNFKTGVRRGWGMGVAAWVRIPGT